MRNKRAMLLVAAAIIMQLMIACSSGSSSQSGLSDKQQSAAANALKALSKVAAATQVGVNYQQYGLLLIEAKTEVNEATSLLPDGELEKELNAAMDGYADAGTAWGEKVAVHYLYADREPGLSLIPKYKLATQSMPYDKAPVAVPDDAMQVIWAAARKHLERASSLINK